MQLPWPCLLAVEKLFYLSSTSNVHARYRLHTKSKELRRSNVRLELDVNGVFSWCADRWTLVVCQATITIPCSTKAWKMRKDPSIHIRSGGPSHGAGEYLLLEQWKLADRHRLPGDTLPLSCHQRGLDDGYGRCLLPTCKHKRWQKRTDKTKELEIRRKRSQQSCSYAMHVQRREQTI